jgi:hypothetical protein
VDADDMDENVDEDSILRSFESFRVVESWDVLASTVIIWWSAVLIDWEEQVISLHDIFTNMSFVLLLKEDRTNE